MFRYANLRKKSYLCAIMSKKNRNNYPSGSRTSWKVVITYLFVFALSCAVVYYIFDLRDTIDNQKANIAMQNDAMTRANQFTQTVHEAQTAANLYAFTDNSKYRKQFNALCDSLTVQADSILMTDISEENKKMVNEITALVINKGDISRQMLRLFKNFDPLADFDKTIDEYQPPEMVEEIIVNTISKDTIIHVPKKKTKKDNFWQRLGHVFYPDVEVEEEDSIVHLTLQKTDTIRYQRQVADTVNILADLRALSDKAKLEYLKKIKDYESKTNELVRADNQLSEQISTLLLKLNQEILDSSIAEIGKSEYILKENIQTAVAIGAATLVLIIIFIILIVSDVNKGHRARKAAEEAKKKTEEIMESRHKLLLSVSHDIKTPLSSILGYVELIDKTDNEKEINSIQQSADHILNLLNNLLEYSSLEQGKLQISNETFNIRQLCDETVEMFDSIAKHKNLEFIYEPSIEEGTYILSDRLKIKQILSNIISNGIKYTLEGSVSFKARKGRGLLVFEITDTGVGIPKDKLEEVFKPFVRIETYNQFAEGSGYGMSVVKGLVDLLGGEIHIDSEVGKGTNFEVRIPVGEVEDPAKGQTGFANDSKRSLNILVIDDDNTLLSVVDTMLHRLGHQAIACRSKSDIEDAIAQIAEYDYILTDREMGALTGNDILHLFKEADSTKPVILMTARMEYTNEMAKDEGFDGFLQKPFNMNQLESFFGNVAASESQAETAFPDFKAFSEMMGNDKDAMTQILTVFVQSTADDLVLMNTLIEKSDFAGMQSLCHKMLPMFTQLERDTSFLAKMNELRSKKKKEKHYRKWKDDAMAFMAQTDELMDLLADKYGIVS